MPATYDINTDAGKVRLLIPDTDVADDRVLFQDAEIDAFLTMEGGNIKLAAAAAKLAVASSEVMVSKVIKTQDLSTDGAKVAAELRAQAQQLRDEAAAEDDDEGYFDIVDFNPYPPTLIAEA